MRTLFLIVGLLFCGFSSSAQQKMTGFGGELSVLSFKPTTRMWFNKASGLDVFAGVSAEFDDFKPNDYEGGVKYLHALLFHRTSRTYLGGMAKWKWLKISETTNTTNLPVVGILIGKEWYKKKAGWKGFSAELGYQYGVKNYTVFHPVTHNAMAAPRYEEFPLIVNLRYVFYKNR